jgi:hypothetical protein
MVTVGQAYINLKPFSFDESRIAEFRDKAEENGVVAAIRNYQTRALTLEIELEEGSLRVRMTIIASSLVGLLGVGHVGYSAIADYKGFKESVKEICEDTRGFGGDFCNKFSHAIGASDSQVFRKERRLKTPGKLLNVMNRLERLEKNYDNMAPNDVKAELKKVREQLDAIAEDVTPDDTTVISKQLRYRKLGNPENWPRERATMPRVGVSGRFSVPIAAGQKHQLTFGPVPRVRIPDFDRGDPFHKRIDLSTYPIEQLGIRLADNPPLF